MMDFSDPRARQHNSRLKSFVLVYASIVFNCFLSEL